MHALIATDGSDVSIEAARKGIALLNPTKVTLLTVADTSVAEDSGAGGFEGNLLSPAEAEQAFRIANEISPADPGVVSRYVALLMKQNRRQEATSVAANAAQLAPQNTQFRDLLETLQKAKKN